MKLDAGHWCATCSCLLASTSVAGSAAFGCVSSEGSILILIVCMEAGVHKNEKCSGCDSGRAPLGPCVPVQCWPATDARDPRVLGLQF